MSEIQTPDDAGGIGAQPPFFFTLTAAPSLSSLLCLQEPLIDPLADIFTDPDAIVSFIIIPARKGFQAAAVTITDAPKDKDGEADDMANEAPLEQAMEEMQVTEAEENATEAAGADWGSGGW